MEPIERQADTYLIQAFTNERLTHEMRKLLDSFPYRNTQARRAIAIRALHRYIDEIERRLNTKE